jgi:hypothetical protein
MRAVPSPPVRRLLVLLACLAAAGTASADPDVRPTWTWSYAVEVSPGLERMRVAVTFPGVAPRRLALDDGRSAPWIAPAAPRAGEATCVESASGGLEPRGLSPGGTVAYDVDLRAMASGRGAAERNGRDLLLKTGRWLLRPARLEETCSATLSFALPQGVRASVAFPPAAGAAPAPGAGGPFVLDASAFALWSFTALGRFEVDRFTASGCTVDLAPLDGRRRATREGMRRWIGDAVAAVAGLYGGRYPRARLQVLVHAAGDADGGDPVDLGATFPGGGACLRTWLAADAGDERLPGEWVAVHELVHLAMPPIPEEDAWLSEGVATYYQEVLRARTSQRDEAAWWRSLAEGFVWGKSNSGLGMKLRDLARGMREHHAFFRTYWASAAVAAIADAEARRASGGRFSLDDAMRLWSRRAEAGTMVPAWDLLREADAAAGKPLLSPVYERELEREEFPSVASAWAWLGVEAGPTGAVRLRDDAPGSAQRRAVMGRAGAPGGAGAGAGAEPR